jgi:hypothetical protein
MINEIVAGVLVDAISTTGRRLGTAVLARRGRESSEDLAVARWFDTYRLTDELPELPDLAPEVMDRLAACLQGNEIQAVLHEILAARLTDAPEADVERIRILFGLALNAESEDLAPLAPALFAYYDGQIAELAGRLEGSEPSLLREIRDEALAARMIAILHAIERHTASLSAQDGQRSKVEFLARYTQHVKEHHGQLEPPDFERRRRIPIEALYVSPRIFQVISSGPQLISSGLGKKLSDVELAEVDLLAIASQIDRAVLLGDPGGGKTTAANVLMYHYATGTPKKIPFLVTLREFAATVPPELSVAKYIEHRLETFYQCSSPSGLLTHLLLTGAAVVIFDGLDELLDATHRMDVTAIIERFCTEFPLVPVLVTSRTVGYEQARLDDRQFTRYRLGGFNAEQVGEYVRKWFAQDEEVRSAESANWANSFMVESDSVPDLRANPLMLALMCILYRGEGSLPRSRAEVYEQCASLLFRKWDARRRIQVKLRAAHLLEPALRHLAWWLFARDEIQPAVTEYQLVNEATAFLHGRGFESEGDAQEAAAEFVEFCRGRLWVFSDTGTTAAGDLLFSFTHRTFLEYFTAAQLAYRCDSPERLASLLAPRVARQEWEIVSELAVQIKDRTSDKGADRVYSSLLHDRRHRSSKSRGRILQYLARSLRSVEPSPSTVRELTRCVLDHLFSRSTNDPERFLPLARLVTSDTACSAVANDEIDKRIALMINSDDPETYLNGLRLAVWLCYASWGVRSTETELSTVANFWHDATREKAQTYSGFVVAAAAGNFEMRQAALMWGLITTAQALDLPGGILPLVQVQSTGIFNINWASRLVGSVVTLAQSSAEELSGEVPSKVLGEFEAVGNYLMSHPTLPWIPGPAQAWSDYLSWNDNVVQHHLSARLSPIVYLGAAAILLSASEGIQTKSLPAGGPSRFGSLNDVGYYILRRWGEWDGALPDLPVPKSFIQLFRRWADNEVDFTQPVRI